MNIYKVAIIAFLIGIMLVLNFVINDLIFKNNNDNLYEYNVICYYMKYKLNEQIVIEAKNEEEAYKIVEEKYKKRNLSCAFDFID